MSKRLGFFKERYRQQFPYIPTPAGTAIVTPSLINSNQTVVFHIDSNIAGNTILDYSLSNVTNSNFISGSALVAGTVTLDNQGNANLSYTYDEGYDANNTANVNFFMNVQSQGGKNLANSNVVTAFQPVTFDAYADGFDTITRRVLPGLVGPDSISVTKANTYTFTGGVDNLSAVYKVIKYEIDVGAYNPEESAGIRVESSIISQGNISANVVLQNQDGNTFTVWRVAHDGTDANVALETAGYSHTNIKVGDTISFVDSVYSTATGNVTSTLKGYEGIAGIFQANANLTVTNTGADPDNTTLDALIVGPGGSGGLGLAQYRENYYNTNTYTAQGAAGGGGGGYISTTLNFSDFSTSGNSIVTIGVGGIAYIEDSTASGGFNPQEPLPQANITTNILEETGSQLYLNGVANTLFIAGRGGSGATWAGQSGFPDNGQEKGQTSLYRGSGGGSSAGLNFTGIANVVGSGGNIAGTSGGHAIYESTTIGNLTVAISAGGGGGGFTSAGSNASISGVGTGPHGLNLLQGGVGGDGVTNSITGTSVIYAAGGGGGGAIAGSGGGTGGSNSNILSYPMGVGIVPAITIFGLSSPVTNTYGAPGTGSGGGGAGALANVELLTDSGLQVPVGGQQPPIYPNSPNPELDMNFPGAGGSGTVIFRWKYRYKKLSL